MSSLAINKILEERAEKRFKIIVPLVYGDDQKRIMREEFSDYINSYPEEILFDKNLGKFLKSIFYSGAEGYENSLKDYLLKYSKIEKDAINYINNGLEAENFDGEKINIKKSDISFEINRSSRLNFGIDNSYYYSFGYVSEILEKSKKVSEINISEEILDSAVKRFKFLEDKCSVHFIAEPGTFYTNEYKKRRDTEINIPMTASMPKNNEAVDRGIYVTVSGISGLKNLYTSIKEFGLKIYTNKPDKLGSGEKRMPGVLVDENILFHFARTGWGSAWLSILSETPLITMPYEKNDDPEIYFNNKILSSLGICKIYNSEPINELMDFRKSAIEKIKLLKEELLSKYETLDGVGYAANKIVLNYLN